ncbi:hypothetical protein SDC9_163611 [bioreactor metagenome]|uniref:Uncharacterized protein n=1 Tax=bioreactor metagenome TaxID=1076179 RepID=A0A645FWC5_9ZZZZ
MHGLAWRQQVAHQLAQRQVALGLAVAAQVHLFGGQRAQAAPHAVGEHPVIGQPAAAGFERPVAVLEDLLEIPVGIEYGVLARKAGGGVLRVAGQPVDEEACVWTARQQALRHQAVVCLHDREHAHRVCGGECPYRWQPRARLECAQFDQCPQSVGDLGHQGCGGGRLQVQHGDIEAKKVRAPIT